MEIKYFAVLMIMIVVLVSGCTGQQPVPDTTQEPAPDGGTQSIDGGGPLDSPLDQDLVLGGNLEGTDGNELDNITNEIDNLLQDF